MINDSYLHWVLLAGFLILYTVSDIDARQSSDSLKIGVSGSEPFVENIHQRTGISLEVWQDISNMANLKYQLIPYKEVGIALTDLKNGKLDAVVGPVSITPERAKYVKFTQPYYQSSLSIMSRNESPSIWERLKLFFTIHFFYAVLGFLFILATVGLLFWLAERRNNTEEFSETPIKGIGDGMWCAIVTMTTTGYGDIAPKTLAGRVVAGCWMVVCIALATTMVAGISSSLALSASQTQTVSKAEELNNKKVAVVKNSPASTFVEKYGAKKRFVKTLEDGYKELQDKKVDAIVFDRPQMLYLLQKHKSGDVTISNEQYMRQGYGFALPVHSKKLHELDIDLLKLQESGRVDRIVTMWLGTNIQ